MNLPGGLRGLRYFLWLLWLDEGALAGLAVLLVCVWANPLACFLLYGVVAAAVGVAHLIRGTL